MLLPCYSSILLRVFLLPLKYRSYESSVKKERSQKQDKGSKHSPFFKLLEPADVLDVKFNSEGDFPVLETAAALALSFAICKLATHITTLLEFQGGHLPCVTAIAVSLATLFPRQLGILAPAGEAIALVLMQVFFAVIGASGSIVNVMNTAPVIFMFASIQVTVHLAIILGGGKLLGLDRKLLLLASNANVGGPTTACAMATAKGWNSLIVPGILSGIFGISLATFVGIGFGLLILKNM